MQSFYFPENIQHIFFIRESFLYINSAFLEQ